MSHRQVQDFAAEFSDSVVRCDYVNASKERGDGHAGSAFASQFGDTLLERIKLSKFPRDFGCIAFDDGVEGSFVSCGYGFVVHADHCSTGFRLPPSSGS